MGTNWLDELKEKAEKAQQERPGPWCTDGRGVRSARAQPYDDDVVGAEDGMEGCRTEAVAEHIAATNPEAVLKMHRAIEALIEQSEHVYQCAAGRHGGVCDCGLEELIAKIRAGEI